MHTVLCFIKYYGLWTFKYFIRYFHFTDTEFFINFFSDFCLKVMECRETMHEYRAVFCICHCLCIDLIWHQFTDTLFPDFVRLTHRYPDIGIDNVCIFCSCCYILCQRYAASCLFCNFYAIVYQFFFREIILRSTCYKMHSQLCTGYHQGISHVITCITHINQLHTL